MEIAPTLTFRHPRTPPPTGSSWAYRTASRRSLYRLLDSLIQRRLTPAGRRDRAHIDGPALRTLRPGDGRRPRPRRTEAIAGHAYPLRSSEPATGRRGVRDGELGTETAPNRLA